MLCVLPAAGRLHFRSLLFLPHFILDKGGPAKVLRLFLLTGPTAVMLWLMVAHCEVLREQKCIQPLPSPVRVTFCP